MNFQTLIADSGSTKTQWSIDGAQSVFTDGINPFYQTQTEITDLLKKQLLPEIQFLDTVNKVFFYGAGCAFDAKKVMIKNALFSVFPNAKIEVESDLLGAARALLQCESGIACILGTGSNSCLYDGEKIVQNVSPLGFILGDEGSGASLGKCLTGNILKGVLSEDIQQLFFERFSISPETIMENVYKKTFPNRFLAKLSVFLLENIENQEIEKIVLDEFERFFDRNIAQYHSQTCEIAFAGSIAHFYTKQLQKTAATKGYTIKKIAQSPVEGLVAFHAKLSTANR